MSPLSHDFGSLTVGQMSATFQQSVNPSGVSSYDVITSITESCPDFYIDAHDLPWEVYRTCETTCSTCKTPALCTVTEYQNYSFPTWFIPSVAGAQSCVVTVSLQNGTSKTFTLSGTGTAPPVDIDVQPGALAFGDVRVNTDSSPASVTVRNLGSGTLNVTGVSVAGPFSLAGPTAFALGGGAAQDLTLTCHPTAAADANGQLTITSDDQTQQTTTIGLQCRGVDSNIGISPSPAVFPTTRVGEPRTLDVQIVNSGGASTQLLDIAFSGSNGLAMPTKPPAQTLAPNGSVSVQLTYDAAAQGEAVGMIDVITSDGPRSAQISALAQLASMSLSPDGEVDLGPVCIGQVASQSFTILGNGDGAFEVTDIAAPSEPFTLEPVTLPAHVAGSGATTTTFVVDATPTVEGPATSMLGVTTDIPNGATRAITVSVTGLAAGVSATPATVDLGAIALDTTTIGQTVKLTNCNADASTWSDARIEGTDAADFAIVARPDAMTIPSAGSVEWLVVFSPSAAGPKTAELVIDHAAGQSRVTLMGDALGPEITDPTGSASDLGSYYTCNAGGASGWIVIGLIVLPIVRRRRRDR